MNRDASAATPNSENGTIQKHTYDSGVFVSSSEALRAKIGGISDDAAMAIVGAVRTNTLLMLVPSLMRDVRMAQAARIANWSPPWRI